MNKTVDILLVEDNPADIRLTMEAFKDGKFLNSINVVTDGEEALHYLGKKGKHSNAARPDLILLDINLPKKDGKEVLREIKNDENLKSIPVIILTTSKAEEDVLRTYNLHANCFITKPVELDKFLQVIKSIEDFWLTIVKLPTNHEKK